MTEAGLHDASEPQARDLQACDLLIEAGWVVPVEPHGVVLEDHAVAVSGGRIVAVLPTAQARSRFAAAEVVQRPDAVLIPGLVNAHTHNPMTLLRGIADDLPLMTWLQQHIWPVEAAVIGPEFVADGMALAIAEMLRGGTTCANENYFFPDVQAAVYKRHGFRALVGLPVIDFPTAWASSSDEYFDRAGEVHDQWRGDALVGTAFAPHAPYTVNDANFERIRMLSDQLDVPVHLHTHETAQEIAEALRATRGFAHKRDIAAVLPQLAPTAFATAVPNGDDCAVLPDPAGGGGPAIGLADEADKRAAAGFDDGGRAIGGAVVDHHDFLDRHGLREHGIDRALDQFAPVVRWYDR